MANEISKTQIDRLGDRLREGDITEADLRLLDEYRRSFGEAYEFVVGSIRSELALEPTGRPAKSTTSISEKLLRESIRLTQVQDIAGCRLVVPGIADQNEVVGFLTRLFENSTTVDRREQPSHGYRAVHIVVRQENKLVEIQIRTSLQHVWAELSEKLSDVIDPAIKYGGGRQSLREILSSSSDLVAQEESQESELVGLRKDNSDLLSSDVLPEDKQEALLSLKERIEDAWENQVSIRENVFVILRNAIDTVPIEEISNVIPN